MIIVYLVRKSYKQNIKAAYRYSDMEADPDNWRKFYVDELTDKTFYRMLSKRIDDPELKNNLVKLSAIEDRHASFWREQMDNHGIKYTLHYRRLKVWFLLLIRRLIGNFLTVRLLEHGEIETVKVYSEYLERPDLSPDFRKNLSGILEEEMEHEEIFEKSMEKTMDTVERNRDIIYGMSDGLVEVLAALAGLTSIITDNLDIALGGLVVGISGTISMSIGAYLSKKSESEYKLREEYKESLFRRKTVDSKYVDDVKGESKTSAINVGLSYILGAAFPIIPFIFLSRYYALVLSIIIVFIVQGISNATIALSINVGMLKMAIRASLLALMASAITFTVGLLFHIFLHISVL